MKLSIIIPIYNAQETLIRCLNSLISQSIPTFEVILIDDGSIDGSTSICQEFCKIDPRFIYIRQDNHGPSSARNLGLDFATGDVISFVDSDDYITREYVDEILHSFSDEDVDVVFFGYYRIMRNRHYIECHIPVFIYDDPYLNYLRLSSENIFGYTWIKAYRRSAIADIRYEESLCLFEDEVFTCRILRNSIHTGVISKPLYYYVAGRSGSLTQQTYNDYCKRRDKIYQAWSELLSNHKNRKMLLKQIANESISACIRYWKERQVDTTIYLNYLSQCHFIQSVTIENEFLTLLRQGDYGEIERMRR